MRYRSIKDKLPTEEMLDPKLRKNVFREMGRDFSSLIKEGMINDRPGTVARLMEKAFQAGLQLSQENTYSTQPSRKARMTDMDLPSRTRQSLASFRSSIFTTAFFGKRDPDFADMPPEQLHYHAFVLIFEHRRFKDSVGNYQQNQWIIPECREPNSYGHTTLSGLFKNDLYRIQETDLPFKYATLTEWGYELLATGSTARPEDRIFGGSSTFKTWQHISGIANPRPLALAFHSYGLISDEQFENLNNREDRPSPMKI